METANFLMPKQPSGLKTPSVRLLPLMVKRRPCKPTVFLPRPRVRQYMGPQSLSKTYSAIILTDSLTRHIPSLILLDIICLDDLPSSELVQAQAHQAPTSIPDRFLCAAWLPFVAKKVNLLLRHVPRITNQGSSPSLACV